MVRDIYSKLKDTTGDTNEVPRKRAEHIVREPAKSVRIYVKLIDAKTREPIDGYGRIDGEDVHTGTGNDGIGWLDLPKGVHNLTLSYAIEGMYKPAKVTLRVSMPEEMTEFALKHA